MKHYLINMLLIRKDHKGDTFKTTDRYLVRGNSEQDAEVAANAEADRGPLNNLLYGEAIKCIELPTEPFTRMYELSDRKRTLAEDWEYFMLTQLLDIYSPEVYIDDPQSELDQTATIANLFGRVIANLAEGDHYVKRDDKRPDGSEDRIAYRTFMALLGMKDRGFELSFRSMDIGHASYLYNELTTHLDRDLIDEVHILARTMQQATYK